MYRTLGVGGGAAGGALAFTGMQLLPWVLLSLGCVAGGVILLRLSLVRRKNKR